MSVNKKHSNSYVEVFDAVNFIIDEISEKSITGHFVLIKEGGKNYTLPPIRVANGKAACLNGVKIRTRFKINFT